MYLSIFTYLILSLTISSIHGRNHYLNNLDTSPQYQNTIDQNYETKPKSYLEKLEEKINYENELNRIERLLATKDLSPNDNQEIEPKNDDIDDYLKYQSTDLLPAFNLKELNNQQINLPETNYYKDVNQINHYLTTMPTELRNKLISGPRLRRVFKKDIYFVPAQLFSPLFPNQPESDPAQELLKQQSDYQTTLQLNQQSEEEKKDDKKFEKEEENKRALNNDEFENTNSGIENLNKEISLEELTKYLMAKRAENLTNQQELQQQKDDKNSDSSSSLNSSSKSKSSKEEDNSKESKEDDSKESKESNSDSNSESNSGNEKKPPNNISTELKKTIITHQNGKAIKKVETYKKSYELSDPNLIKEQSNSYLINPPNDANYEKILQEASMPNPILINQRNSLDEFENDRRIKNKSRIHFGDIYFIGIVVALSMVSILSVIGAGYLFYRFQQHNKATQDVDYPAYGIIGPAFKSSQDDDSSPKTKKNPLTQESLVNKATNINHQSILSQDAANNGSDRKLAQSAQMYHYHHQKQQMILTEKNKNMRNTSSDVESDEENEENEEGDYTVYECPGLATNLGEIEITNPNFQHENIDDKKAETDKK